MKKTKAQKYFENLKSKNIGISREPEVAEQQRKAFYTAFNDFGTYMYQLALQGKLFTMHRTDVGGTMRCVNAELEKLKQKLQELKELKGKM